MAVIVYVRCAWSGNKETWLVSQEICTDMLKSEEEKTDAWSKHVCHVCRFLSLHPQTPFPHQKKKEKKAFHRNNNETTVWVSGLERRKNNDLVLKETKGFLTHQPRV